MESTDLVSTRRDLTVRWRFWLRWVVANAFGFGIGFPLGWSILLRNESSPGTWVTVLTSILAWALVSAIVGIVQWLVVRAIFSDARWILATVIGWTVGVVTSAAVPGWGMPAFALVYGAAVGLSQALVFRWSFQRAALWISASAAGWAIGWALLTPLQPLLTALGSDMSPFALGTIIGTVSGIITGLGLVWLLRPGQQADI